MVTYLPHLWRRCGRIGFSSYILKEKMRTTQNNGEQGRGGGEKDFIFPLVLYPDTSGMAHVIGMIDCVITWLKAKGDEIKFAKYEDCARSWKSQQKI
jgi:hypothetical protein